MNDNEFKLTTLNKIIIGVWNILLIPNWIYVIYTHTYTYPLVMFINIIGTIVALLEIPWFLNLKKKYNKSHRIYTDKQTEKEERLIVHEVITDILNKNR